MPGEPILNEAVSKLDTFPPFLEHAPTRKGGALIRTPLSPEHSLAPPARSLENAPSDGLPPAQQLSGPPPPRGEFLPFADPQGRPSGRIQNAPSDRLLPAQQLSGARPPCEAFLPFADPRGRPSGRDLDRARLAFDAPLSSLHVTPPAAPPAEALPGSSFIAPPSRLPPLLSAADSKRRRTAVDKTRPLLQRPTTARASRRGMDATEAVLRMAQELDLVGPLGLEFAPLAANRLMSNLIEDATWRCSLASDTPRLSSALGWLSSYMLETGRTPFVPAFGPDALRGQIYNRCTLDTLKEYIRQSTPMGKTKRGFLAAGTIDGYISAIRNFRCREARYDIAPLAGSMISKPINKQLARQDGVKGGPVRMAGIRAQHLRVAAAAGYPRDGVAGAVRWAVATGALNLLLRGGEVGVSDTAEIDPSRIITWLSFCWMQPCAESKGRLWLIVRVVPIKDQIGFGVPYPCGVPRQHDGPFGSDPVDPYDALAWAWWIRIHPNVPFPVDSNGRPSLDWDVRAPPPPARRAEDSPGTICQDDAFFTHTSGDTFRTSHVSALGKSIARVVDIDPADVGAKCFRIGGSTDWRAAEGPNGTGHVIQKRGRWSGDSVWVYSRHLVEEQLHFASLAGAQCGADLEAICAKFVLG